LKNLKYLSFGSGIEKGDVVSKLVNLEELYIDGCKQLPNLRRLARLKKLCVSEGEMVVVNSSYRINKLSFLENLTQLEYLDINRTSYSGSSKEFEQLSKLKAVTFPSSMYNDDVQDFIKRNKAIKVLNAYEFEY
jgi:Leucine-rich repeat (LRR) protein